MGLQTSPSSCTPARGASIISSASPDLPSAWITIANTYSFVSAIWINRGDFLGSRRLQSIMYTRWGLNPAWEAPTPSTAPPQETSSATITISSTYSLMVILHIIQGEALGPNGPQISAADVPLEN